MEFKAGDRVHVKKLDWEDVDFFATLEETAIDGVFSLIDCSLKEYSGRAVIAPHRGGFGNEDYYTLATDEEDTEEPVIQRTTDTHDPVNKPSHYMLGDIEVKDIITIVADKYHKGSVAHNVASALEYQMRAPEKNGLEDIKKARKCLDFAIENWED
ncbi:DUF3310 domain-containing protein [Mammaliicoccus sciuri]|uniref:DUF3310 domain-containing protein n=1 Tax=Mammaliicoccus sciuri TaxID=1296 RepID=UPI003F56123C